MTKKIKNINNKKTIFLIDDNQDILDAVGMLLTDSGYNVISSENTKILDTLKKNNLPDMILLDMLLSGSDGRDMIRKLKGKTLTKNIPIILNSAHYDARTTWKSSKADDFIAKPFDINHLLLLIDKHIKK